MLGKKQKQKALTSRGKSISSSLPPHSQLTTPSPSPSPSSLTLTAPSPSSFTLSPAVPHQNTSSGPPTTALFGNDTRRLISYWRQGSTTTDSQPTQFPSAHSESLSSHLYSPPTIMRHGYHGFCLVSLYMLIKCFI